MTVYLAIAIVYDLTLLLVCFIALMRGGRPERLGALICFTASALSSAARLTGVASWAPSHWLILAIDGAVVVGFFWLAITTIRFWPIWAAAFALDDIFVNVAGVIFPRSTLLAYESGLGLYAYLALFVIALASLRMPRDASAAVRHGGRAQYYAAQELEALAVDSGSAEGAEEPQEAGLPPSPTE